MTYNPAIPQSTDLISTSQGEILTNFAQLNTIFSADHYTWNDGTSSYRGLHKQIDFPLSTSQSLPAGDAGVLYTHDDATPLPQLFFANSAGAVQLTGLGSQSLTTNGYIKLPGGLIIQWGTDTATLAGNPVGFSITFATCYSIVCTEQGATALSISTSAPSSATSSFTAYSINSSSTISYVAIGV